MERQDWRQGLKDIFDGARILEKSKADTLACFEQFCEFIFEPAFESLADAKMQKVKGREVRVALTFRGSKDEQFIYRLLLPKNSIELRLTVVVESRKTRRADLHSVSETFKPGLRTADILKLDKEDVVLDIIGRYRSVVYESLTSPD